MMPAVLSRANYMPVVSPEIPANEPKEFDYSTLITNRSNPYQITYSSNTSNTSQHTHKLTYFSDTPAVPSYPFPSPDIDGLEFVIEICKVKEKEFYFDTRFGNIIPSDTLHPYYKNRCNTYYALPVKNVIDVQRRDEVFTVCLLTEENDLVSVNVKYYSGTHEFSCYKYDPTKIIPAILENDEFAPFFMEKKNPFFDKNYVPNYSERRPRKLQFSRITPYEKMDQEIKYEEDVRNLLNLQEPSSGSGCASCGGSPRSRMVSPTEVEREEMEILFNAGVMERKPPVKTERPLGNASYRHVANQAAMLIDDINDHLKQTEWVSQYYANPIPVRTMEDIYKAPLGSDSESLKPTIPKLEPRDDNLLLEHDEPGSVEDQNNPIVPEPGAPNDSKTQHQHQQTHP